MKTWIASPADYEVMTAKERSCSDLDEDCASVADHQHCFNGHIKWWPDGTVSYLPMADGFCPFVCFVEKGE